MVRSSVRKQFEGGFHKVPNGPRLRSPCGTEGFSASSPVGRLRMGAKDWLSKILIQAELPRAAGVGFETGLQNASNPTDPCGTIGISIGRLR
jgi:hypothetical protein